MLVREVVVMTCVSRWMGSAPARVQVEDVLVSGLPQCEFVVRLSAQGI